MAPKAPKRLPPLPIQRPTASESEQSPPHTPTQPSKFRRSAGIPRDDPLVTGASNGLKVRPAVRDTFLDDITPTENTPMSNRGLVDIVSDDAELDGTHDDRISHDLSLSARESTRHSLVDNMLLSLDQMAIDAYSATHAHSFSGEHRHYDAGDDCTVYYGAESGAPATSVTPTLLGRSRGHTHSSSYSNSSDYDQDLNRHSQHLPPRSRRSNSSSNFQVVLERIDSLRASDRGGTPAGDSQRAAASSMRSSSTLHLRGQGGSGRGGLDDQLVKAETDHRPIFTPTTHRRTGSNEPRATSFDDPMPRRKFDNAGGEALSSTYSTAPVRPYDAADAAPMPTVPAGPRGRRSRQASPVQVLPSLPAVPPPEPAPPEAWKSAIFPRTIYSRSGRVDQPGMPLDAREIPPMPVMVDEAAAPAPTVGYRKASNHTTTKPAAKSIKEPRPGFFRRVFGSSKNIAAEMTTERERAASPGNLSVEARSAQARHPTHSVKGKIKALEGAATGISHPITETNTPGSSSSTRSSAFGPAALTKEQHPILNKKSSFFGRRRKKSMSEAVPILVQDFPQPPTQRALPPSIPLPPPPTARSREASPVAPVVQSVVPPDQAALSPISSLRQVMHPALRTPTSPSQYETFFDSSEQQQSPIVDRPMAGSYPRSPHDETHDGVDRSDERRRSNSGSLDQPVTIQEPRTESHVRPTVRAPSRTEETSSPDRAQPTKSVENSASPDTKPTRAVEDDSASSASAVVAVVAEAMEVDIRPTRIETPAGAFSEALAQPASNHVAATPVESRAVDAVPPSSAGGASDRTARPQVQTSLPAVSSARTTQNSSRNSPLMSPTSVAESDYRSARSVPIEDEPDQVACPEIVAVPSATTGEVAAVRWTADEPETTRRSDEADAFTPTPEDREQARQIFDGAEDFINRAAAAAWLGQEGAARSRVRRAYVELFDWRHMNILAALRSLCARLILRGETQQVDRMLGAVAERWVECNANHGFRATDIVHMICYSLLLLNTDLYLADIESKMTRSQFVKNIMPTIRRLASFAGPDAVELPRALISSNSGPTPASPAPIRSSVKESARSSFETGERSVPRFPRRPSIDDTLSTTRSGMASGRSRPSAGDEQAGPLVSSASNGSLRAWETQIENVLRNFYNSVRAERLPLYGGVPSGSVSAPAPSTLSVLASSASGMLRRSPSVISKAPSENASFRGRATDATGTHSLYRMPTSSSTGRWPSSKTRTSRPRLHARSTTGSSRTSFEDEAVLWSQSPTASTTWSRYSSTAGRTHPSSNTTNMSVGSLSSGPHLRGLGEGSSYEQSIGFAHALSQAIIREESATATATATVTAPALDGLPTAVGGAAMPLLDDETLGLLGAPWAKEGLLKHKHHLISLDRRAKDRAWSETFAVIEKGWLRLFSFHTKSSSRAKASKLRSAHQHAAAGGVVGGGNWQANAEAVGEFLLRQTIASALPSPGYSKQRPWVWALSLPGGGVHLFQGGTEEIVREWVATANYWSARLSKEPLVGGVSNVEYGWSGTVMPRSLVSSSSADLSRTSESVSEERRRRPSFQSSLRSSVDQASGALAGHGHGSPVRVRLAGDKATIKEWSQPQQSMMASQLLEVDQLNALTTYIKTIESELAAHNELRAPMNFAFSPRHPNAGKAMTNWERKSSYLLREIVKFRTYIDCLVMAREAREEVEEERMKAKTEAQTVEDGSRPEGGQGQSEEQSEGLAEGSQRDNHEENGGRGDGDGNGDRGEEEADEEADEDEDEGLLMRSSTKPATTSVSSTS